jgi:hypothetical protein
MDLCYTLNGIFVENQMQACAVALDRGWEMLLFKLHILGVNYDFAK